MQGVQAARRHQTLHTGVSPAPCWAVVVGHALGLAVYRAHAIGVKFALALRLGVVYARRVLGRPSLNGHLRTKGHLLQLQALSIIGLLR